MFGFDQENVILPMSRRQFLTLSTLMALPFHRPGPLKVQSLVQPLPEQETHKQPPPPQEKSLTASLAEAIVIKNENVCFLADPSGMVPIEDGHALGLYYHDCRFLNGYEIRLSGKPAIGLCATAARGLMAKFELTNPTLTMPNGGIIQRQEIGIQWHRMVDGGQPALCDRLLIQNFGRQHVEFILSLTFRAAFEDVLVVRGSPEELGFLHRPTWRDGMLYFLYEGKDELYRCLAVHFSPLSPIPDGPTAHFRVSLAPRETKHLHVSLMLGESEAHHEVMRRVQRQPVLPKLESDLQEAAESWLASVPQIVTNNLVLEKVLTRSLLDLRLLQSKIDNLSFYAAGVPLYATLFGRDSLITALQTLAYDQRVAEQTLRLLARYQGQREDDWRDEQPGKILHELRTGELARLGVVPHTPYYGSIDATLLFLILIGQHAAWTGSLALFHELHGAVERALEWMAAYGDNHGTRYVWYASRSAKPLDNQGWKDSGEAIVNADGTLATPPIALVEVQGYAYRAKLSIAELYDRAGDPLRARQLRREAELLRRRFNRDFWLEEKGFYALALQKDDRRAAVISSNPGQALWTGIADPEKARRTVERLMADDMFTGWGIRTLSEKELAYSPLGYHLGTVWPHDNSLIAAGFRRYGHDQAACRIFTGLLEAAMHFKGYRLPELFAGFNRAEYDVPVAYAVANPPQAWAAGAIPYLVETLLGLVPEAFERRLRIVRPVLPEFINELEIHRLRVGDARLDLSFKRVSDGSIRARLLKVEGDIEVVIESTNRL